MKNSCKKHLKITILIECLVFVEFKKWYAICACVGDVCLCGWCASVCGVIDGQRASVCGACGMLALVTCQCGWHASVCSVVDVGGVIAWVVWVAYQRGRHAIYYCYLLLLKHYPEEKDIE